MVTVKCKRLVILMYGETSMLRDFPCPTDTSGYFAVKQPFIYDDKWLTELN